MQSARIHICQCIVSFVPQNATTGGKAIAHGLPARHRGHAQLISRRLTKYHRKELKTEALQDDLQPRMMNMD